MSIENTRERKIRPTHPGEMLREDFLTDYGLTVSRASEGIRGFAPDCQRTASRAARCHAGDGSSACAPVRQHAGVLAQCSACSRSLGCRESSQEKRPTDQTPHRGIEMNRHSGCSYFPDRDLWPGMMGEQLSLRITCGMACFQYLSGSDDWGIHNNIFIS